MHAALLQTLLAAFCAILAHHSFGVEGGGMMRAATAGMIGGKAADPFAALYPRWGTGDLVMALNGIYNQGAAAEHDSSATTWVDLTGNVTFAKLSSSVGNALWDANCMRCDATKRCLKANLDLSGISAFTLEVFGYYNASWGMLLTTYKNTSGSSNANDVMAYGNNVGAEINLHQSSNVRYIEYQKHGAPSTTDLCLTCDGSGNLVVYANGTQVATASTGSAALEAERAIRRIVLNGEVSSGAYSPNGSKIYGATIYGVALTPQEVSALYAANRSFYGI